MNKNPLEVPVKGSTLEKAIINVLNKVVRDMYNEDGTIKFAIKQIDKNKQDADTKISTEESARKQDVIDLCDMIIGLTEE